MPNWCINKLTIRHDDKSMLDKFEKAYRAWSPPLGFYERLVVLGFDVQASYFEPGMSFAGTWDNGIEDYYEGHWGEFPEELQNIFSMHEYYDDLEVGDEKM